MTKPSSSTTTRTYPLRNKSGSSKDPAYITPTKTAVAKAKQDGSKDSPSTPCNKCTVCMCVDSIRNMKLNEAFQEFVCKIDDYKLLSKSLQENASTLNHSIDTIKDFIRDFSPANAESSFEDVNANLHILNNNISELSNLVAKISPGVAEDSVTKITDNIDLLHDKIGGISNHVPKLNSIEKYLSDRPDFIHASDIPSANSDVQIDKRLDQLESLVV